jgi:hypothetical protein
MIGRRGRSMCAFKFSAIKNFHFAFGNTQTPFDIDSTYVFTVTICAEEDGVSR